MQQSGFSLIADDITEEQKKFLEERAVHFPPVPASPLFAAQT